jgi:formate/nitrite transporter
MADTQPTGTGNPLDAYTPAQMAERVETVGLAKAGMPFLQTLTLGMLAGAFIAFGAMLYTLVMTQHGLGFGPARLLGGTAFSLGLILVVVGGAELFTGNSLIVMAWAEGKVSLGRLGRNWGIVYFGNLIGSIGSVILVWLAGTMQIGDGAMGQTAAAIAAGKLALGPMEAFARGILCNALVCLAVWLCFAAHDVTGKILAIVPPIAAFVALGFEHSVANMYLIPAGMVAAGEADIAGFVANLVPVTLGNIVGGGVFVALVYWVCYLRGK